MTGKRLALLRQAMVDEGLDCLAVTGQANRRYLSGFTGDQGVLIVTRTDVLLFTDFRYVEQAGAEAPGVSVRRCARQYLPDVAAWLSAEGGGRIGIEAAHWSLADYQELVSRLPAERLVPTRGMVEKLRMRKEPAEIDCIAGAAAIADRALARLIPQVKPGASEAELAALLDYLVRQEGGEGPAFTTIVASGPRGALPHGTASPKLLAVGELVVIDFGACFGGYASDITRTFALGGAGEEERRIYRIVAEAQARVLGMLRPGLACREADAAAREYIQAAGYGEYFGHGLGHSVGLEIHESPALSETAEEILAPGMVVTVEPGIYLPGRMGVRIEDLVVIEEAGCRILTGSPKELTAL